MEKVVPDTDIKVWLPLAVVGTTVPDVAEEDVGMTVPDVAEEDVETTVPDVAEEDVGRTVPGVVEEDPRLIEVLEVRSAPEVTTVAFGALVALDKPPVIVADESLLVLDPRILEIILTKGVEVTEEEVV